MTYSTHHTLSIMPRRRVTLVQRKAGNSSNLGVSSLYFRSNCIELFILLDSEVEKGSSRPSLLAAILFC